MYGVGLQALKLNPVISELMMSKSKYIIEVWFSDFYSCIASLYAA